MMGLGVLGDAGKDAWYHRQGIAEDEPIRPIHWVLIELDRLAILLLRVREERSRHVLPRGDLENGMGGDALVNLKSQWVDHALRLLALAAPFELGVRLRQRLKLLDFFIVELLGCPELGEEFVQAVGAARGV